MKEGKKEGCNRMREGGEGGGVGEKEGREE